jgi:hypothetical protein
MGSRGRIVKRDRGREKERAREREYIYIYTHIHIYSSSCCSMRREVRARIVKLKTEALVARSDIDAC